MDPAFAKMLTCFGYLLLAGLASYLTAFLVQSAWFAIRGRKRLHLDLARCRREFGAACHAGEKPSCLATWIDSRVPGHNLGRFLIPEREGAPLGETLLLRIDEGEREAQGQSATACNVVAAAAPAAGAAPTMSGVMQLLAEMSADSGGDSGGLPLGGLMDALFTTYIGCCLAVLAIVLGALRRKQIRNFYDVVATGLETTIAEFDCARHETTPRPGSLTSTEIQVVATPSTQQI